MKESQMYRAAENNNLHKLQQLRINHIHMYKHIYMYPIMMVIERFEITSTKKEYKGTWQ